MKAIIVLPTYNEAENLENLVSGIGAAAPELDILIIDDNSPAGTGEIADRLASENLHVKVVHRPVKSGRGSATVAGFRYAIENGYELCLEIDCDLSHPPSDIPRLIEAAGDADLVIASRFVEGGCVEGWNWKRRLIHFLADLSVKIILGTPNTDHTNGFRCYRTDRLARVDFSKVKGFGYIGQTLLENLFYRAGFKIKEVSSVFRNRFRGRSKMGRKEMIHGIAAMIRLRWNLIWKGVGFYIHRIP